MEKKLAFGFPGVYIYIYVGVYVYNCIYIYIQFLFFFARADLVRDLRPLALPCCSNYYGGAKSGEKRISLRKGEIWRQQSVQNSTSKQEFMYMYRSAEE